MSWTVIKISRYWGGSECGGVSFLQFYLVQTPNAERQNIISGDHVCKRAVFRSPFGDDRVQSSDTHATLRRQICTDRSLEAPLKRIFPMIGPTGVLNHSWSAVVVITSSGKEKGRLAMSIPADMLKARSQRANPADKPIHSWNSISGPVPSEFKTPSESSIQA
jgi:hypothetical protein